MSDRSDIPLKGSTSGMQYAGWEPRTFAMDGLGDRVLILMLNTHYAGKVMADPPAEPPMY